MLLLSISIKSLTKVLALKKLLMSITGCCLPTLYGIDET